MVPDLPAPSTLEASGLTRDLLMQLALKTLHFAGELSGADLARRLGVLFAVVEPAIEFLRSQRHVEVVGAAIVGGASYRYRITTEGRAAAGAMLEHDQYVGVAPVPLAQYARYMATVAATRSEPVTRQRVAQTFSHLVLSDRVLEEIGPAVNSGHSLFIYGPPGNGKTMIAQGLRSLLGGQVAVPHALEVDGSIITVFDRVTHEPAPGLLDFPEETIAVDKAQDQRWVVCRRPLVGVGGELSVESFDLTHHDRLGFYRAPLQLVSNGGVLLIDDFGRQRCRPDDLLNRWMVPLESGVDYLTLRTGLKFAVPFHVFVAFATNLNPRDLVDEAFLRRVQYKVFASDPTDEQFVRIFEKHCEAAGATARRGLAEWLLREYYTPRGIVPRGCHPRDLINHALLLARYRGDPPVLTPELMVEACDGYFVGETP